MISPLTSFLLMIYAVIDTEYYSEFVIKLTFFSITCVIHTLMVFTMMYTADQRSAYI